MKEFFFTKYLHSKCEKGEVEMLSASDSRYLSTTNTSLC